MLQYLRMESAWIGPTKRKMNGVSRKCYAFRCNYLPFGEDLEYTKDYLERKKGMDNTDEMTNGKNLSYEEKTKKTPLENPDLPF